jgi:hypothetical protein
MDCLGSMPQGSASGVIRRRVSARGGHIHLIVAPSQLFARNPASKLQILNCWHFFYIERCIIVIQRSYIIRLQHIRA